MTPIIVDRSMLWALAVKYTLYGMWGTVAFITGILPIRDLSGYQIETFWAIGVALLSWAITVAILRGADRLEAVLTSLWIVTVALYPIALIIELFAGTLASQHVIFLALGFLVIPIWRWTYLFRTINARTRAAREVAE